jgi:hypothetical protein
LRGYPVVELGDWDDAHRYALYRCFDEASRLLYVGISKNSVKTRLAVHRHSRWWHMVVRIEVTYGYTRKQAAVCEMASIRGEEPLFNVQGFPGDGLRHADLETRLALRKAGVSA